MAWKMLHRLYILIYNHILLSTYVKRWHFETSSVHLPINKMAPALDNVSCLLHLSILYQLLYHTLIYRSEVVYLLIDELRAIPKEDAKEIHLTQGFHARFKWMDELYNHHLPSYMAHHDDVEHKELQQFCTIMTYFFYLVFTTIFVSKSQTYTYVMYLRYFTYIDNTHEFS